MRKRPRPLVVDLHPEAEAEIHRLATIAGEVETGGLLLGWWDADQIVARQAVEVLDPAATSTSWTRDSRRSQHILEKVLATEQHPWLGYIGDWHTHPAPCGPSPQDNHSICRASENYSHPLLLLVHRSDQMIEGRAAWQGQSCPVTVHVLHPRK
ncbi:Mov34/MPN/PAD-1 family protein [Kocuria arenosa]|uniref:Mov34/MPN/PAD-1 family protein n=1 Tax=Kocuria arenosa TaxID=3071446 RepID=UPI0034D60442